MSSACTCCMHPRHGCDVSARKKPAQACRRDSKCENSLTFSCFLSFCASRTGLPRSGSGPAVKRIAYCYSVKLSDERGGSNGPGHSDARRPTGSGPTVRPFNLPVLLLIGLGLPNAQQLLHLEVCRQASAARHGEHEAWRCVQDVWQDTHSFDLHSEVKSRTC